VGVHTLFLESDFFAEQLRVARSQKLKRPNLTISSFKKAFFTNNEKGHIRPNFQKQFTKIYQINFEIS
jgi:hypothetical protein